MTDQARGVAPDSPLIIRLLFETALALGSQEEIVYADHRRHSYAVFGQRVQRLAAALTALGARSGQTIGVMDWDSHRYLECFFAIPMMGAVLHTINVRLSPEQILYTINHAEDDFILAHEAFLPVLEQIWDRVDAGKILVLLTETADTPMTNLPISGEYEAMLEQAAPGFAFPDLEENKTATIFYTTGTTGLPKGVVFSHRQLVLHSLAVRSVLAGKGQGRFNPQDVYMPITPMFHVHAWGLPYVATTLGVRQVYPGRYEPEKLLDLIQREAVTFSHCVPTIFQMMLGAAKVRNARLDGWTVIVGGSPLPLALCKQALSLGVDVFTGYGMSETGPILTLAQLRPADMQADLEKQAAIRCMAGRSIPMVQIRIVDAAMNNVPHDGKAQGEVVARAPWLTKAYLKDPIASQTLWEGGWLHTGDIATMNQAGYLKITDRMKDVIKSGGEWISSLDIEDFILRHHAVAEVAVVGVPDQKWAERPLAVIVVKPGAELGDDEIRRHLQGFAAEGLLSAYAVPEQIMFVPQLPRTSVGKLDKRALRARHATP
jgi:fatty-acyl-CoA synthase